MKSLSEISKKRKNFQLGHNTTVDYGFVSYCLDRESSNTNEYFPNKDRGILYVGHTGTSGYSIAARGYMFDMIQSGYNVSWSAIEHGESEEKDLYTSLVDSIRGKDIETEIMILHEPPLGWEYHYERNIHSNIDYTIGFTVWETESLPKEWVSAMNSPSIDEIWCPTNYNKDVFLSSGVEVPIRVVPHVWMGRNLPQIPKNKKFTFYNISEFIERKGIEDLINIYCQEFNGHDDVQLFLKLHYKTYDGQDSNYVRDKISELISSFRSPPEIKVVFERLSDREISEIHARGHCYVSLCRSEGFGLTILDAYNYKIPIVVTGYGGHVEFLGIDYPGLIPYEMGKVKNMQKFNDAYTGQEWAYPNLNIAKKMMRREYQKWVKNEN
tara:strand:+ start:19174 stop:20319 length:1146 start_codon:yes stop_codon:yes gene_type:complete